VQPLIRTIPGSGRKSLHLASHASHVIGSPVPEGRLLLLELMEHATQSQFVYRHRWQDYDVVIWDNRATMHRATRFNDTQQRRELVRTTTIDLPLATVHG
jgi:alpha-ketoglutarate-dependent 2,4-dichlorophenoxyacetate dioxygenase